MRFAGVVVVLFLGQALALQPAPPPQPTESGLWAEAGRAADPAARLAAFEAFLKRYPASPRAAMARREIVQTAFKVDPRLAHKKTGELVRDLDPVTAAELWRVYAAGALAAGKDLGRAEKAAARAVSDFEWSRYLDRERTTAAAAGRVPLSEGRLRVGYQSTRTQIVETYAETLIARNKHDEATPLLKSVLAENSSAAGAAFLLSQVEERRGQSAGALRYAAHSLLARASPERRQRFASLAAAAGLAGPASEDYLDSLYRELFPPPVHWKPYQPGTQRTRRTVLAEVFTGAGCPPCVAADLAFDAVLESYSRQDVIVAMFHEHIPRPDPLTNPASIARYQAINGRGVPTVVLDGEGKPGGGPREYALDYAEQLRDKLETRLQTPPGAEMALKAERRGDLVTAQLQVSALARSTPDLTLHFAVVEKMVRYSGESGIRFHPMVVRHHAAARFQPESEGPRRLEFDLAQIRSAIAGHLDGFEKYNERHNKDGKFRFMTRPEELDGRNLAVLAWLQDAKTSEVLQAAWSDVPPGE